MNWFPANGTEIGDWLQDSGFQSAATNTMIQTVVSFFQFGNCKGSFNPKVDPYHHVGPKGLNYVFSKGMEPIPISVVSNNLLMMHVSLVSFWPNTKHHCQKNEG